jgi:hypothetical protein
MTYDQLENNEAFMEKLSNKEKGSGTIVETKLGQGITKNEDDAINGKVPVYLDDGRKVLCSIEKIKVIGFYD